MIFYSSKPPHRCISLTLGQKSKSPNLLLASLKGQTILISSCLRFIRGEIDRHWLLLDYSSVMSLKSTSRFLTGYRLAISCLQLLILGQSRSFYGFSSVKIAFELFYQKSRSKSFLETILSDLMIMLGFRTLYSLRILN